MLNDTKTEVLHFSSRFIKNPSPISAIQVGDTEVGVAPEARNLGALIDRHMSLIQSHVNKLCRSASLGISKIGRIRKYIDRPTAERLVHVFVTSHLDANNSLLYGLPNSAIAKLQRVQNGAARVVLGVSGRDVHLNALRKNELHWLPVKDRIVYKILLLTYKSLNGLSPAYIRNLLAAYTPGRSLRSALQALLVVPKTVSTKNYGDRAFSVAAPKL
ncbi:hypothetical protein BSL78_15657 [Apostichopus japonicus]|uniref:RNA-directed DNA polymerase from mobile element jockey-like n=1 Tax=Stichopus japonicus TaxID=307972 RepID=A0A2G8KHL5_STIJA|nr:hypothetical protein BSL78_15657 [Apostichopus japonicus]